MYFNNHKNYFDVENILRAAWNWNTVISYYPEG